MQDVSPDWVAGRLARWRMARDNNALGELLNWQRDRAYAIAFRILGNGMDAEDSVQQGFMKSGRNRAPFSLVPW